MISSITRNFTQGWCKPKEINLTNFLNTENTYYEEGIVSIRSTTNRSNKPGEDILSTPSMISAMDELACRIVSNITCNKYFPVTNKINVIHKAPLKCGEKYLLEAKVLQVKPSSVEFFVKGIDEKNKKVFGESKISIDLIQKN